MATVYSMSKVTIIAATSTSCHSGFLGVERRQDQLRALLGSPFQLTVTPVCISGFHKYNFVHHPHDPLDTRGWTLQEEASLPDASLGFGKGGVGFSPILKHVLCQALDASTTPVYQGNEFGAVSEGTVSLYGPYIHYTVQFQETKPEMTIRQEMTPELEVRHITLDCPLRKHLLDDGITLQRSMCPTQQETGEFSVSVLILGQSGKWNFKHFHGLILGYAGNGQYQRLGKVVLGYVDREAKFSAEDFTSLRREVVIV
ncbi:hypothetical protein CEP54_012873 [Fusarium duplospermum]|uniref:Uncharacterized protein n=1 Tax=Fusarium duplospermum TaxID=1325734 RepID=A0A428P685_9HYPO|nr:hypothetical protein CEP54_012873 [Fusarium duplospermum]